MSAEQLKMVATPQILILKCSGALEKHLAQQLEEVVNECMEQDSEVHVLDFTGVISLEPSFYRHFTKYNKFLRDQGKSLKTVNMSPPIKKQVTADGLIGIFNPVDKVPNSAEKKNSSEGKSGKALTAMIVNTFIEATKHVFDVQVNMQLEVGAPKFRKPDPSETIDVASIINLNSSDFRGALALSFSADVLLQIHDILLDDQQEELNEEVLETAGELLNMIYGTTKSKLVEKNLKVEMAIPTTLMGSDLKISFLTEKQSVIIPFGSKAGSFFISVVLSE